MRFNAIVLAVLIILMGFGATPVSATVKSLEDLDGLMELGYLAAWEGKFYNADHQWSLYEIDPLVHTKRELKYPLIGIHRVFDLSNGQIFTIQPFDNGGDNYGAFIHQFDLYTNELKTTVVRDGDFHSNRPMVVHNGFLYWSSGSLGKEWRLYRMDLKSNFISQYIIANDDLSDGWYSIEELVFSGGDLYLLGYSGRSVVIKVDLSASRVSKIYRTVGHIIHGAIVSTDREIFFAVQPTSSYRRSDLMKIDTSDGSLKKIAEVNSIVPALAIDAKDPSTLYYTFEYKNYKSDLGIRSLKLKP